MGQNGNDKRFSFIAAPVMFFGKDYFSIIPKIRIIESPKFTRYYN